MDRFIETNADLKSIVDSRFVWVKVNYSKENRNEAFLSRWPKVRVLLTSGFPGSTVNRGRGLDRSMRLLSKPYRKDQLARALREILDQPDEPGE